MTSTILLDTHIALWLDSGDEHLRPPTRDPADRLLIATAIELACPLVTYDDRILRFAAEHGRQYGFASTA